jgi:hypothetical protein
MQSLEVSKIRGKNKKFPKCDHRFGNTFTFCTDISYIYVKNLNT